VAAAEIVEAGELVERDADLGVSAPDRMAVTLEVVGLDDERKRRRQSHRGRYLNPRTARGNVADHAVNAAAADKSQRSLFENALSGCFPLFDHRRCPFAGYRSLKLAPRNYGQLNPVAKLLALSFRFRLPKACGTTLVWPSIPVRIAA
jgi:hypothetical protein